MGILLLLLLYSELSKAIEGRWDFLAPKAKLQFMVGESQL